MKPLPLMVETQSSLRRRAGEMPESAPAPDCYKEIFESIPIACVVLDTTGVVIEANLAAARMLGMERDNLVARKFARVVSPDSQETFHRHLLALLDEGGNPSCDLSLFRADGEIIEVIGRSSILCDGRGGPKSLLCAFQDVTQRSPQAARATRK